MSHAFRSLLLLGSATALVAAETLPVAVEFNRDIRPILSNTCFRCHGPDKKANVSGLRLDLPEVALAPHRNKSGREMIALVPGQPDASEVWRRVSSRNPDTVMPPPDALHQLVPRDKALLKRWIEQGAKYQPHWAYVPPVKRAPPAMKDAGPDAHPIDSFIRAGLAARGIAPAPEASRRTLIRRLSLDLTGLPPTPAETEDFVNDRRSDAYEQLVDRLLASPHYGERMAVPWLDLVRFADSVGYHGDQEQNVFPYRDYVIAAFNRNEPFDQFTVEQIAGDLLPGATPEQRVASGFNRLNMMTREGGAQPKEYLAKYAADRVRTVSTTWLGSTMACAECHDHKFDPFSTKDFYSLAAYFADIKQWGVYTDYDYTPEPELAGFNNDYPFPPEIEVTSEYLQQRAAGLRNRLAALATAQAGLLLAEPDGEAAVRHWAQVVAPRLQADEGGWASAAVERAEATDGVTMVLLPDGGARMENPTVPAKPKGWGAAPTRYDLTLHAPPGPVATVRLEVLPDDAHAGFVTRDKKPRFDVKLEFAVLRSGESKPQPLAIAEAFAEGDSETYFNGKVLVSLRENWRSAARLDHEHQTAVYHLRQPPVLAEGDRLIATLSSENVGRVRLAVSPLGGSLPGEHCDAATRAAFAADSLAPVQLALLAAEYFRANGNLCDGHPAEQMRDLLELADCREGRAFSMVTVATEPRVTRVLRRGNWQDESGEVVLPAPPHFLPGAARLATAPRATRLDLAHWLVSRENPLTARTFVNRLWKQFFGTGLAAVIEDLGMQGEYPSHPELFDWLAVEFMDRGWDIKATVRLIVTSATYRQSSTVRPELNDVDPTNRLLARQNARRLEAEFVRDNALAAAGLLNPALGGPSVRPYQPDGYYEAINFPQREYVAQTDDRQYRRGLYMHWQRTFLHPMLANFDAPSREECTASRNISTTPQQALTLLNDPTFVEAARALAEQLLQTEPAARLDAAFARVLARPPTERERTSLGEFHTAQLAAFRARPDDARKLTAVGLRPVAADIDRVELAAWTAVARVLLNLNETIVRY